MPASGTNISICRILLLTYKCGLKGEQCWSTLPHPTGMNIKVFTNKFSPRSYLFWKQIKKQWGSKSAASLMKTATHETFAVWLPRVNEWSLEYDTHMLIISSNHSTHGRKIKMLQKEDVEFTQWVNHRSYKWQKAISTWPHCYTPSSVSCVWRLLFFPTRTGSTGGGTSEKTQVHITSLLCFLPAQSPCGKGRSSQCIPALNLPLNSDSFKPLLCLLPPSCYQHQTKFTCENLENDQSSCVFISTERQKANFLKALTFPNQELLRSYISVLWGV